MDDRVLALSVEITVDSSGRVWVNVDGECVLRIQHARYVYMDDPIRGQAGVYRDKEKDR